MSATQITSQNGTGEPDSEPGGSLYDRIADLSGEAQEELGRLDGEITQMQERHQSETIALKERQRAEAGALNDKQRRVRGLLKALGVEVAQPERATRIRSTSDSHNSKISATLLKLVLVAILDKGDADRFTRMQIAEECGRQPSDVYRVFQFLRKQEVVAKSGKETGHGAAEIFRVLDRHIGERLLSEANDGKTYALTGPKPDKRMGVKPETAQLFADTVMELTGGGEHEASMGEITTKLNKGSTDSTAFRAMDYLERIGMVNRGVGEKRKRIYTIADSSALERTLSGDDE